MPSPFFVSVIADCLPNLVCVCHCTDWVAFIIHENWKRRSSGIGKIFP